jgi:hypothetical protein
VELGAAKKGFVIDSEEASKFKEKVKKAQADVKSRDDMISQLKAQVQLLIDKNEKNEALLSHAKKKEQEVVHFC